MNKGTLVIGASLALLAVGQVNAQCEPRWLPPQQSIGTRFGTVEAIASWDRDGPGPLPSSVVIGGEFAFLGGGSISDIAIWDGSAWSQLGDVNVDGGVFVLAPWDADGDGPGLPLLVAGGEFWQINGVRTDRIACWDGISWRPIGARISGPVHALAVRPADPAPDSIGSLELIAGGDFRVIDEAIVNNVARWDGIEWRPMGAGLNSRVLAMTNWDPDGSGPARADVVAAGNFTTSAGAPVRRVARWNGTTWTALGDGMNARVLALCNWDPDGAGPLSDELVAAGDFSTAGGVAVSRIARWNGVEWKAFGSGFNAVVYGVAAWDPDGPGPQAGRLIAAGEFTSSGGTALNRIAQWDGEAWQPVSSGANDPVRAVAVVNPQPDSPGELVAGGDFVTIGDVLVNRIARHDGDAWRPFGDGLSFPVNKVLVWDSDDDGPLPARVYAGGRFVTAGGQAVNHIASWDGLAWHPLGTGTNGDDVAGMTTWDPDGPGPLTSRLIVGGSFQAAGGTPANHLAMWDGSSWSAMGAGVNGPVAVLTTWDPDGPGPQQRVVVAGGYFSTAPGGVTLNRIAWWDGVVWRPFGAGFNSDVTELIAWDPDGPGPMTEDLIATGRFDWSDGEEVNRIARWTGSEWERFGGLSDGADALTVWDPDGPGPAAEELLAAGQIGPLGTWVRHNVLRWTGSAWVPATADIGSAVLALLRWNPDGIGPDELIAGGRFSAQGHILRWNGTEWLPMGGGVNQFVNSLVEWRPSPDGPSELVAAGDFYQLEGAGCGYWARWTERGQPIVARHPMSADVDEGEAVQLTAAPATGYDSAGPLTFQWMRDGLPVQDGAGGASSGGGTVFGASGSLTSGEVTTLTITGVEVSDGGTYMVVFSNSCGSATSDAAAVHVGASCPVDLNGDGFVDFSDYLEFLTLFDAADASVDFNADGFVDFADYLEFLTLFDAGC